MKKLEIPYPKAKPGTKALVLNYNKYPSEWEMCTVESLTCNFDGDLKPRWKYDVRLDRLNKDGRQCLWLYVGDDSIKLTNQCVNKR